MPVISEIVHQGVTQVNKSEADPAVRMSMAVYPELFSPIETGIYVYDKELVLCLSTQIGCLMGCSFCDSTGPFKFKRGEKPKRFLRSLRAAEILAQALAAIKVAEENNLKNLPLLFSFMGMGEPLANYMPVVLAIKLLGQMFPESRATISTICHAPRQVERLAGDIADGEFPIPVKLHFSLHAPNDKLRRKLMPAAAPLAETIAAARYFGEKTGHTVKANYTLMKNVNSRPSHEDELVRLLLGTEIVLKVSDLNSRASALVVEPQEADAFAQRIAERGVPTCRFRSLGQDIGARCGELTVCQTG